MQVKVYSRPGVGNECDQGRFEYNGSFWADVGAQTIEHLPVETYERWARMLDCFQEVLFVIPDKLVVSHSRTWL